MRSDQIESVVAFILNWEERAVASALPTPVSGEPMMGADIQVELPPGDAERGRALAEGTLGCSVCHGLTPVGPAWAASGDQPGLGERAALRVEQADYAGEADTAEQYLFEFGGQPQCLPGAGV